MLIAWWLPTPQQSRKEIYSGGHGGISLSRASCQFNDTHPAQCTHIQTSCTYRKTMQNAFNYRLHSITRRHNRHLLSERYETWDPQQCIVSIWTQELQQSQRSHVHGRHGGHPHQLWSSTQYFANNQSSDVIGHRGRTGRIVHQFQNGVINATDTWGNGTPTNSHIHSNWQLTAHTLLINKILPNKLKAMDMGFHWLCCLEVQDQYWFY